MDRPFALVDVFADVALTGNPLAVVGEADGLSTKTMRRAAVEFQQSETTFVMSSTAPDADWRLRSFTPTGAEVVGVGHNALGAWWWLAATGRLDLPDGRSRFHQEIGERVLPVEVEAVGGSPHLVVLRQPSARFGPPVETSAELAGALGVGPDDLAAPAAEVVSTGADHLMVELGARELLDTMRPDPRQLRDVLAELGGQGCYVWTPTEDRGRVDARFFNPAMGILEDAATGSAAGPLAALLVRRDPTLRGSTVIVDQGRAMGRPSRLQLVVDDAGVQVRGACVTSVSGVLHPPVHPAEQEQP